MTNKDTLNIGLINLSDCFMKVHVQQVLRPEVSLIGLNIQLLIMLQ